MYPFKLVMQTAFTQIIFVVHISKKTSGSANLKIHRA